MPKRRLNIDRSSAEKITSDFSKAAANTVVKASKNVGKDNTTMLSSLSKSGVGGILLYPVIAVTKLIKKGFEARKKAASNKKDSIAKLSEKYTAAIEALQVATAENDVNRVRTLLDDIDKIKSEFEKKSNPESESGVKVDTSFAITIGAAIAVPVLAGLTLAGVALGITVGPVAVGILSLTAGLNALANVVLNVIKLTALKEQKLEDFANNREYVSALTKYNEKHEKYVSEAKANAKAFVVIAAFVAVSYFSPISPIMQAVITAGTTIASLLVIGQTIKEFRDTKKLEKEAGDYVDNKRAVIMDNKGFSETLEKANELVNPDKSNEFKKAPVAVASYNKSMTNKHSPSIPGSSKTRSYTSDVINLVKSSAERRGTISKDNKNAPVKEGPVQSGLKRR